jgi:hypothetical protein
MATCAHVCFLGGFHSRVKGSFRFCDSLDGVQASQYTSYQVDGAVTSAGGKVLFIQSTIKGYILALIYQSCSPWLRDICANLSMRTLLVSRHLIYLASRARKATRGSYVAVENKHCGLSREQSETHFQPCFTLHSGGMQWHISALHKGIKRRRHPVRLQAAQFSSCGGRHFRNWPKKPCIDIRPPSKRNPLWEFAGAFGVTIVHVIILNANHCIWIIDIKRARKMPLCKQKGE